MNFNLDWDRSVIDLMVPGEKLMVVTNISIRTENRKSKSVYRSTGGRDSYVSIVWYDAWVSDMWHDSFIRIDSEGDVTYVYMWHIQVTSGWVMMCTHDMISHIHDESCVCEALQHTATHCNTLQHTATHCNTLQHTATHCNTLCICDIMLCVYMTSWMSRVAPQTYGVATISRLLKIIGLFCKRAL